MTNLTLFETPPRKIPTRRARTTRPRPSVVLQPTQLIPLEGTEELYNALRAAYATLNSELFEGRLPEVVFTMQRSNGMAGFFHARIFAKRGEKAQARMDEVAINPKAIASRSDIYVLQVLTHEMCHVWQEYFGRPPRLCYHNAEFAAKMEEVGLITSTDGSPTGARTGQKMMDYIAPGGRFIGVANALIASGWSMPWDDVSGRRDPARQAPTEIGDWLISLVEDAFGGYHYVVHTPGEKPVPPDFTKTITEADEFDVPDIIRALKAPDTAKEKEKAVVYVAGKTFKIMRHIKPVPVRVSRHKFACPKSGCATVAWASGRTRIKCAKHNVLMPSVGVV